MAQVKINGLQFAQCIRSGAVSLQQHVAEINALNVFPVPDGDTGTNMNLTWQSGLQELNLAEQPHLGQLSARFARGLMLGARGNSGVILSQLFRGFCKYIESHEEISAVEFAAGMQYGVELAYRAIQRPAEGTILTVAREAAQYALSHATSSDNLVTFLRGVVEKAAETLARTPEMLPILKQAGVVDSGGKGLLVIYEGMLGALLSPEEAAQWTNRPMQTESQHNTLHEAAQHQFTADEIEQGYCTEFMIRLSTEKLQHHPFEETAFRDALEPLGDSLLVITDDHWVKVHIHSETPGLVLSQALLYGDLDKIKIDNMRMQHEQIVGHATVARKPFGFVAVANGDGMCELFKNLGVDEVIAGGQSMNPSTEQFVAACKRIHADTVFILPNNSNVLLAAGQAAEMTDKHAVVIPSKSMQQGVAALIAVVPEHAAEKNEQSMLAAIESLESASITVAVRDTELDGMDIAEGDFIGLRNNRLTCSAQTLADLTVRLLSPMVTDDHYLLTIYTGQDADESARTTVRDIVEQQFGHLDVEWYEGGQPVYSFLFALE